MSFRMFALALAVSLTATGAVIAQAFSSTFTISNYSGSELIGVYAGPSSDPNWGLNILTEVIYHGEDFVVTLNDPVGNCYWDLRYEFADGTVFEEYEVDICVINGETFEISGDDGIK